MSDSGVGDQIAAEAPSPSSGGEGAGRVVAAVLRSFSAPSGVCAEYADDAVLEVAQSLQQWGAQAPMLEAAAVLHGASPGRLSEIIGLLASAGEQVGLAWTSMQDAQRWVASDGTDLQKGLAGRALAEMASHYLLGAAHAFANHALRILLLSRGSREVIERRTGAQPPFTDDRNAWISFNGHEANELRRAASTESEFVQETVTLLLSLANQPSWKLLASTRARDYHRWRPQSVDGGVAPASPWHTDAHGQMTMSIGVDPSHTPDDPAVLVHATRDAMLELSDVLATWENCLPQLLRDLGGLQFNVSSDNTEGGPAHLAAD